MMRNFKNSKNILLLFLIVGPIFAFAQPTISSFEPTSQLAGFTVEIKGSNFGTNTSSNTVKFGGVTATLVSANSTVIVATVPNGAKSGNITVELSGGSTASKSGFVFIEKIDQIHTDYQGYWFSSETNKNSKDPDLSHNVLGFKYGSTTFSTGVTDSLLTNQNVTYTPALWNALPVNKLTGSIGSAVAVYASKNDGSITQSINPKRTIKDLLIDGKRGLDIGTGVANFGNEISFTVTNIDSSKLADGEPDILITQVAQPTDNTADYFYFTDSTGKKVGSTVSAISQNAPVLGTYLLDIYSFNSPYADTARTTGTATGNQLNTDRDIRLFAFKLSDFNITRTNYDSIRFLKIEPNGTSDYAFVAYNANTFIVPTAAVTAQPTSTTSCAGSGTSAVFSVSASNPTSVGSTGGTITYQWKKDGNNISGATGSSYTVSPITAADFGEYVCEITNNFGSILSDPAYLNVRITVDPVAAPTCINTTATALSLTAIGNAPVYQWHSNTTNSFSGASVITGATSNSYTPPSNTAGTNYYFCVVSDPNASGCTISDTSAIVSQLVSPASVGGTSSGDQDICYNTSATITLSGNTGNVVRWEYATTSNFSGKTNVQGTSTTYNTTALTSDRYYRAVVKSGTCAEATSTGSFIDVLTNYVWEGDVSTDFGTGNNWLEGCVPHTGADIAFRTATAPDRLCNLDQNRSLRNISIGGTSATHIFDLNNFTLTTTGTLSTSGANLDVRDANSNLTFAGATAQTLPAGSLVNNEISRLTINNSSGVSLAGTTNLIRLLTLTAGTLTTNNNLTFKSTADLTAQVASIPASGAAISGNVTVEKYVKARRAFRLLGATVNSVSHIKDNWQEGGTSYTDDPNPGFGTHITGSTTGANGLDATQTGNTSLFTFDNSTQAWSAITNTTTTDLEVGTPYRLMVRGGRSVNIYQADNNPTPTNTTLRTYGTLHRGDYTFNNLSSTPDADNFVVNPYQCAVDLSAVLTSANTHLDYTKVYMWDPFVNTRGAWATVTLSNNTATPSGTQASKYLQPGQAFFVKTASNASAAPTVVFSETDKYTGGDFSTVNLLEYESARNAFINVSLINRDSNVVADETFIKFAPSFQDIVTQQDALKFWNLDEVLGTVAADKILAINAHSLPQNITTIPLHLSQYRATNYTFRLKVNGLNEHDIYLHDKEQNRYYKVSSKEEKEIPFSQNKSDARRFELIIQPQFGMFSLSQEQIQNSGFRVYPNPTHDGHISVELPPKSKDQNINIEVLDLNGKVVLQQKTPNANQTIDLNFSAQLSNGVYQIRVNTAEGSYSQKVVLQR